MPLQQALPTWLALNNANFTSPTGLTDMATGQPIGGGGLNAGDYFDVTNQEAATASFTTNGTLYAGRYRLVQVDSGATAANVKTGTVGYLRVGTGVQNVVTLTPGSGQTPGVYTLVFAGGGGFNVVAQVVVGAAGTVTTNPVVLQMGSGFNAAPTATMPTAAGGTGATFAVQMSSTPNVVTSADKAPLAVRPVVFLNAVTPGNYGFIQELGTATVLGASSISGITAGSPYYVNGPAANTPGGVGTVTVTAITTNSPVATTIGQALDAPVANNLFKAELQYVPVVQG